MHINTRSGAGCGWIVLVFMGLIFTGIGVGVGWFIGWPTLQDAKASESWPSVKGKVIESELVRSRNKDNKSSYSADVIYEFTVDGEEFEGDNVWFGQYGSSNRSEMQKIVTEYPVGKEVDVYYKPDDPNESVLQPGAFTSSYMLLIFGGIFAGVGLLMLSVPIIKMLFFGALVATSTAEDFGGGGSDNDDTFSDGGFRDPRFDDDPQYNSDDDGFEGIPGA